MNPVLKQERNETDTVDGIMAVGCPVIENHWDKLSKTRKQVFISTNAFLHSYEEKCHLIGKPKHWHLLKCDHLLVDSHVIACLTHCPCFYLHQEGIPVPLPRIYPCTTNREFPSWYALNNKNRLLSRHVSYDDSAPLVDLVIITKY